MTSLYDTIYSDFLKTRFFQKQLKKTFLKNFSYLTLSIHSDLLSFNRHKTELKKLVGKFEIERKYKTV